MECGEGEREEKRARERCEGVRKGSRARTCARVLVNSKTVRWKSKCTAGAAAGATADFDDE